MPLYRNETSHDVMLEFRDMRYILKRGAITEIPEVVAALYFGYKVEQPSIEWCMRRLMARNEHIKTEEDMAGIIEVSADELNELSRAKKAKEHV